MDFQSILGLYCLQDKDKKCYTDFVMNVTYAKSCFLTPQTTPFGQLYDAF